MKYPRVTEILSPLYDGSHFTEESRQRGTEVHKACAAYAQGLFYPLKSEYRGYFESFKGWFDKFVVKVYFIEQRLTDERLGFTGQPDLGAELLCWLYTPVVIDIKTGSPIKRIWQMQKAAYLHLSNMDYGLSFKKAIDLILDADGRAPKVWGDQDNLAQDFAVFLSQLNVFNYMRRED